MNDIGRNEKRLTIRDTIIAIGVIIFFVAIIFIYYRMLYNEKKNGIIKSGEMTAKESADHIDQYLTTNIDSIKLAAYTLDGMINEGRTDDEIQDYLVGQSTAVRNAVIENSTGLYGYINGRFFSGTNWEPPAGYEPTERPWYKRPFEDPGEITILDPYIDLQSGNVMLALGKVLCDGESVISVDVSLEQIQMLTEEAVLNGDSDVEMILNDKGVVVAHSDRNEIEKNYSEEEGTLGAAIVHNLGKGGNYSFELPINGAHYMVYVADIRNGWNCISVKDATRIFASLNYILLATIAVVVLIVLVLSIIMNRSNRYLHLSVRAMAASEAKSEFLSRMSHEIRTPINTMMGMNEMILRESGESSVLFYSENIKAAGIKLLGLVNNILNFSKMEDGETEIINGDHDLSVELTEDYEEAFRKRIENSNTYRENFTAEDAKVLVVDDNPMNLMVFKSLVKQTAVQADAAEGGDEGIALSLSTKYDLIFLDHMMPEKDGIETLHEIRENPDNPNAVTPVVCLTANAISGAREKYIEEGFDDYLTKPIDPERLEELMLSLLPEELITLRTEDGDKRDKTGEKLPEEFDVLDGSPIDTKTGLKNSGTVDAYISLLKIFYQSVDEKTEELNRMYEERDIENYTIKVHALKSSARIIGAAVLGEDAQRLEDAGKAEDTEYIRFSHEPFITDLNDIKKLLSEVFHDDAAKSDKPEADPDLMNAVFEEAKKAAIDMDCERLDSIFEEMEGYSIPENNKELFDRLREALDKYEYKTMLDLLQ